MSEPVHQLRPRQALQERVAAAIVEAAARVLAERGEQASMTAVATAAGVARATVYRYFPSREALLTRVAEVAVADAGARLASARISEIPPDEGVTRAVRALADVGDPFVVFARERLRPERRDFDDAVATPLEQLFERGQAAGAFRTDVSPSWLVETLFALIASVLTASPNLGWEDTTAAITSLFLDGARARREPDRRR
jgi:TetR/AcrR family transcriptional repressor of mexCD-oprJ operon